MYKVFVYGSLRPPEGKLINKLGMTTTGEQIRVQGFLYELSWFPGIKLDPEGGSILCDILEVNDEELAYLDYYEGYYPEHPQDSLFVRHRVNVAGHDGYIYEYNGNPNPSKKILTGDWLLHSREDA